jgi:uncharacterized membrane-anchored protein YhcB (DUF1043 family)
MNPQVEAALIAGIVSLGGTVAVAVFGFRTTKTVTEKAVQAGHEDTRETLTEQRKQLDKTFAEQREQLGNTLAEQHIRTLNERFATAAEKLGGDKPPAVRLAGVYAMAGLADDWEANRQVCIDVLCGYLRIASKQLIMTRLPGQRREEPVPGDGRWIRTLIGITGSPVRQTRCLVAAGR